MLDTMVIVAPMTQSEARECVADINARIGALRERVLEFYTRRGWAALGYANFQECAPEFGASWQHVYRLKDLAQIESGMQEFSPAGELIVPVPQRHLQQLKKLPTNEARVTAYANAKHMANLEGAKTVTERHVEQSVKVQLQQESVFKSRYHVLGHMVTTGDITAAVGMQMDAALEKLKPRQRGQMMELIARHGLTCPDLIAPMGADFARLGTPNESRTLAGILATGCVAGVPLSKATLTDYEKAKKEAQSEYIAESEEARRRAGIVQPIIITVYKNDAWRTFKELRKALTVSDLLQLQRLITDRA